MSRDNMRNQIKSKAPFKKGEAQKAVGDASQAAHPSGERDPAAAADLAAQEQQEGKSTGLDARAGAQAGFDTLKNQASEGIPDERKDQAKNYKSRGQDYLKGKMPKERREQTIWRLKKMVVEIQGHQDCKCSRHSPIPASSDKCIDQRAIETLLRLAEEYSGHSKNVAQQGHGAVKGAHTDDSLQMAEADLKVLLPYRFCERTSANADSTQDSYRAFRQQYFVR